MSALPRFVQFPRPAVISPARQAAESAVLYILLCTAYIVISGYLAARAAATTQQLHTIETIKGVAFIGVTGVLFFAISYARWRRIRRQEDTIIAQEKTLLRADRRLVAAMSFATVAHDLNNLLLSLSGLVEELKDREKADPSVLVVCRGIGVGIDKLRHLTQRAASAVGRAKLEKEEDVDLKTALHELASIVRAHPEVRFCTIAKSDVVPLTLVLNRTLFEEAVLNLLINAGQAAGPAGQIEVRLAAEQGAAILAIHDSGSGVPDDVLEDIFEPCFTTKPNGTGIGLLAVSAFAASCGAGISVGRSPLGGALFELRIPMPNQPSQENVDHSTCANAS